MLEGITVLDLTRVVAGPACTRTLSDFGAEVIKIEPPDGDLLRRGVPKANGVALPFAQQNAGKQHLCIDLTTSDGQRIVSALAEQADVLVENYRPGVAGRLGLSYEQVRKRNPDIVYCSISGYGQTGSAAGRRAYAPIIHAELGLLALNAREREMPPLPEAVSHADFAVGAQAASAILAALVHRERTGEGQSIDVSMAETMLATNEFATIEINGGFGDEISPFRPGKALLLEMNDGSWVQLPGNPTTAVFAVARALDRTAELEERGWNTPVDTQNVRDDVIGLLQGWAREFPSGEAFEEALDSARMPLGTVKSLDEVIQESWVEERNALVSLDINGEERLVPRSPVRFSGMETGPRRGSYLRGADNRAVLGERLGLSDEEMDDLQAHGVIQEEYRGA